MLIIADERMPLQARHRLEELGEVLWMEPQSFTYTAIAAHPDIFYCQNGQMIIAAPNAPEWITKRLREERCNVVQGERQVGHKHPETVFYNAVFTGRNLIHNTKLSDTAVLDAAEGKDIIHVSQGYTRCNLLALSDDVFLTSDRKTGRELAGRGKEVCFVKPEEILLPGVRHGFIGGCCGVYQENVVVIGAFHHHSQGDEIRSFLEKHGRKVIELYDGPLWDGGSLFFIECLDTKEVYERCVGH